MGIQQLLKFNILETHRVDTFDDPVSGGWILNLSGDDAGSTSGLEHKKMQVMMKCI
jgi:hypothetical protein